MITGMPRIAIAVRDLDVAADTFRDAFAMPVTEVAGVVESLGVRIAMCTPGNGSNVELMSPADPAAPSPSPETRDHSRANAVADCGEKRGSITNSSGQ